MRDSISMIFLHILLVVLEWYGVGDLESCPTTTPAENNNSQRTIDTGL